MPRSSETQESKILAYFQDESPEKIGMLFGLIAPIVKKRVGAGKKEVAPRKKKAAERRNDVPDNTADVGGL